KPHHGKARVPAAAILQPRRGSQIGIDRLQHELGKALAGAHHIGGPNRLVSAYENEFADAMPVCRARTSHCSPDIVLQSLDRIVLNERDMFVSRSVIDRVGLERRDDFAYAFLILNGTQHWNEFNAGPHGARQKFLMYPEKR